VLSFEKQRRELVEMLKEEGIIKSQLVEEAMLSIPREHFVPPHLREHAYSDTPLPIGCGQTISAPHMVALMTEELRVEPGHRVLEVGTGSGYQAAILAYIVSKKPQGHVFTIERIPELAYRALRNIAKCGQSIRRFTTVVVGDGSRGLEEFAPYDRIIVTAAAPSVPRPLIEQLKPGGIMVIPVGSRWSQILQIVEKGYDGRIRTRNSIPCIFVPLIGEYGWRQYDEF